MFRLQKKLEHIRQFKNQIYTSKRLKDCGSCSNMTYNKIVVAYNMTQGRDSQYI